MSKCLSHVVSNRQKNTDGPTPHVPFAHRACRAFPKTTRQEWLQMPFLEQVMGVLLTLQGKIPLFGSKGALSSRHLPLHKCLSKGEACLLIDTNGSVVKCRNTQTHLGRREARLSVATPERTNAPPSLFPVRSGRKPNPILTVSFSTRR